VAVKLGIGDSRAVALDIAWGEVGLAAVNSRCDAEERLL
jgi:hypothetical protein